MVPNPRRRFLACAFALAAFPAAACVQGRATPAQTEGPFYSPNTPRKSDFRPDAKGQAIVLEGKVYGADCKPLANAWLDFWHADETGDYDHKGFRLRGHQFTDAAGRYRLDTILPAIYPGRTRHIHVKLRAPGSTRVLTTQVYFPDDAGNARDGLYRPELLARRDGATLKFDFVLPG